MNRYTHCLFTALCLSALCSAPLMATESEPADTADRVSVELLKSTREKLCRVLSNAGVISEKNAQTIIAAPVKIQKGWMYINVKRTKEGICFFTSPEVMTCLEKRYEKEPMTAAEEYLGAVAEAIGDADMWIRLHGDATGILIGEVDGWKECVKVSAMHLLMGKKQELKDLIESYSFGSSYVFIRPYVKWDEERKLFLFNEEKFAEDKGL